MAMDDYDEKILQAASKIFSLIQSTVGANASFDALTSSDVRKTLNNLLNKLWNKRREVAIFGTGVFAQLIENSITRLDKKEGATSRLKASGQQDFQKVFSNKVEYPSVVPVGSMVEGGGDRKSSSRLDHAKRLLEEVTEGGGVGEIR